MNEASVYLKPNVVIEPLIDNWYAWSHLISPATAAMNIKERHVVIMDSFINSPEIHVGAVNNPKLRGGPFMDHAENRLEEVKELKDLTLEKQKDLLELADAIAELQQLLSEKAKGYSLEELYQEVPVCLQGYVELVYDLNNNPSFRLFESLLYHSKFYKEESQSIALWISENDERPFVLSTPRLKEEKVISLPIPFSHSGIDQLAKMKRIPGDLKQIAQVLGIQNDDLELFKTFFTRESPPPYVKYSGDKVRMRYFGHACILVETAEVSILIDPLVSYYGNFSDISRFSDMDLPDQIDYVLITHNHQDHILFETLLPLRHKIKNIVIPRSGNGPLQDPDLKLMFNNIGFNNVIEIGEMEDIHFHDAKITGVPFLGEHCDLNIATKICHHVQVGNFSMLFAADSCNIEPKLYEHVHRVLGNVDVVFLGMECEGAPLSWLYGPLLTKKLPWNQDQSRRLAGSNFNRAKAMVDVFNPYEVYVYAMGQEPWCEFISSIKYTPESKPIVQSDKLIKDCSSRNIVAERLFGEKEILYSKQTKKELSPMV